MATTESKWRRRIMRTEDVDKVVAIDSIFWPNLWDRSKIIEACRERSTIADIFENNQRVSGYCIARYVNVIRVVRFGFDVLLDWHTAMDLMVSRLKEKAETKRINIAICVAETDLRTQRALAKRGFRASRVIKGFYRIHGCDPEAAYEMVL